MNLIVNTPEPMRRMRLVTTKELSARTLAALHRAGVLHAEESAALDSVDRKSIDRERSLIHSLLSEIENVLAYAPADEVVRIQQDAATVLTRSAPEIEQETRRLCGDLTALYRRAERLEIEERQWLRLLAVAKAFPERTRFKTSDLDFTGEHLFSRLAVLPRDGSEAIVAELEQHTLACERIDLEDEIAVFLIGESRERKAIEERIRHHGDLVTPPAEDCMLDQLPAGMEAAIVRLRRERADLQTEIEKRRREHLEDLILRRETLFAESERLDLLELACESEHATLFEGWIPESAAGAAVARLREEIGCVHIETAPARDVDEPPSKLRNIAALRPFEVVVNLFGTPNYRGWDPTPVIAYSFAFFFGVMLGDVVYGIFLILLTRFILPKLVEDTDTEGFARFQSLLYISAGAAVIMGVLTGTYLGDFVPRFFGAPDVALFPAVRDAYLDAMTFIVATLLIGIIHVNLGHFLMLIRGIREKKRHLVFGRTGIFLLQLAGIPWAMNFIGFEIVPLAETAYTVLAYGVLVSVVLLIAASVIEKGAFLGGIFWIFDITGILGDVMSYARLAGVGLATYYLAYCFNLMSTLVTDTLPDGFLFLALGSVITLVILFLGHAINLLLSSITCFVHSLRLCFVEFLFKFYEGEGRTYAPLRLHPREFIPVRAKT